MNRLIYFLVGMVWLAATAAAQPYRITDVSPDMVWGIHDRHPNTGGKVMSLATDPTNPNILYAVSEYAGVWKSTDRGRLWSQTSRGIKTNQTLETGPLLAVDPMNGRRLVYVTDANDYRPAVVSGGVRYSRYGGLYVSLNGADEWTFVRLPHVPIGPVCFGSAIRRSYALVLTDNGLYISGDDQLNSWTAVRNPSGGVIPDYFTTEGALGGEAIFASSGGVIYKTTITALVGSSAPGSVNPWVRSVDRGIRLPTGSNILRLCIAPVPGRDKNQVIVMYTRPRANMCPAGSEHDGSTSGDYSVAHSGQDPSGQSDWKFCHKCYGLFFDRGSNLNSRCPGGGSHANDYTWNYTMRSGSPAANEQSGWKWCRNCEGLFYSVHGNGRCIANSAGHNGSGSSAYVLTFGARAPYQNQWKWCRNCQGLFYAGVSAPAEVMEISVVDFERSTRHDLNFHKHLRGDGGYVLAAARPASVTTVAAGRINYDIYASDRLNFFQYQRDGSWLAQQGLHADSWGMAFPVDYDPPRGIPTVFASHDGGVSVKRNTTTPWVASMNGLHAYNSSNMAGVSGDRAIGGGYGFNDVLYVPSAHNEAWVSRSGGWSDGGTALPWSKIGALGDIGRAYVDPALPGQVAFARNTMVQVYTSSNPRSVSATGGDVVTFPIDNSTLSAVPGAFDPNGTIEPPQIARFSQIMTLQGEDPGSLADYVVAGSSIMRSRDGGQTWRNILGISVLTPEQLQSIAAIATSGGHQTPTVYLLMSQNANPGLGIPERNYILKGTVNRVTGYIDAITNITETSHPNRPVKPSSFCVNPYNPQVCYTVDMENLSIKFTLDGGATWHESPQLKSIATNNDEYKFEYQRVPHSIQFGPLQEVLFSRSDPNLRIAILFPGGVAFSRDPNGHAWTRIDDNLTGIGVLRDVRRLSDLVAHPYSGFLAESSGSQRLYLAMYGRGIVRIDGPFISW